MIHRFQVMLHDCDAAGVLFFAHLFRHAHDAYERFMAGRGAPLDQLIRAGVLALPLVHAEADYRRPLRHGAIVDIDTRVARIGRSSFTMDYRFQEPDGQIGATAMTIHACLDARLGQARLLPATLIEALETPATAPAP